MYISRGLQQLETSKAELEVVEDELEALFGGQQNLLIDTESNQLFFFEGDFGWAGKGFSGKKNLGT